MRPREVADPATPVVIVENGTLAAERAIETNLDAFAAALHTLAVSGPSIIFVGLSWAAANLTRPPSVETFVVATAPGHPKAIDFPLAAEGPAMAEVTR